MPAPYLEEVFKTNGVPTHTFVEPVEYRDLLLNLRTPGRGLVIEGPSGIGKTTAVETALKELGISTSVTKLSARNQDHVEYIELPGPAHTKSEHGPDEMPRLMEKAKILDCALAMFRLFCDQYKLINLLYVT